MTRSTSDAVTHSVRNTVLAAAGVGIGAFLAVRAVVRRGRRMDFRGRTVFITGASRGLGLVLARQFAAEGANVAVCARDEAELSRAAADLRRYGTDVLAVACDVTDKADVDAAVAAVADRFGRIDVLVNNAGTISVGPMDVMTLADYETAMKTHFWGPLYTTLAVLPHLRARGEGRIVNISSVGGKIAVPHLLPYSASKFALTGFSEGLRAELAGEGIYVTTVCPGLLRTGSHLNATFKGRHKLEYAWFTIGDSLPVTSMDARRAARQVIDACRYGTAEVVLSIQAKLAVAFHDLFTNLAVDLNGLVNRALPGRGNNGGVAYTGKESESALTPHWLAALSDKAARDNNELSG